MQKPSLYILAAGLGSRYGGLKQIDPVDEYGNLIIDYSIFDALHAGFESIVFIIKKEIEQDFREAIGYRIEKIANVKYAYQELDALPVGYSLPDGRTKPWGTGHTIICAKEICNSPFAVINADDYYGPNAYKYIYDFLINSQDDNEYAMVAYDIAQTLSDYGEVTRGICQVSDDGYLRFIQEISGIAKRGDCGVYKENGEERVIEKGTVVSMNFWGFKSSVIQKLELAFPEFLDNALATNPMKAEYLLPTAIESIVIKNQAKIKVISCDTRWFGVTYRDDMPKVQKRVRELKQLGHYKEKLWSD